MPVAEITLAADVRSAGEARRFLAAALRGWGAMAYRDDATVLLSELVANAVLHARTDIALCVDLQPDCLRLSVTDHSPRQPVLRHYSDQSTTGRGLTLVGALARRWGVDPVPDGGKTVWAEVGLDRVEPAREKPARGGRVVGGGGAQTPAYCQGETSNVSFDLL